ncbi:PREDICTED: uncharacterized protein LOC109341956 [Lupinus angustifolius]|uniref:uncharacterized protein LOC109341956 n=1 Tax=Lupinus angustifolius TaxID=3871 RepID=UPI00092E3878|nr:PREDICTED: uncharacterized protein LOC109341956 [Lupinus angustifolius]
MYVLSQKLKALKEDLKVWNKNVFGNIHLRVQASKSNVEFIQSCIQEHEPINDLLEQEERAPSELIQALLVEEEFWREKSRALLVEEEFWREKSRVNWHTLGDRNTSFFHKVAKMRKVTNSIAMMQSGDLILDTQDDIASHVLNYYTELFDTPNTTTRNGLIQQVIPHLLHDEDNYMLTKHPSPEEIKLAVFAMNGDGAHGPDGFGGSFYQQFWDIVGVDVYNSVSQFFS